MKPQMLVCKATPSSAFTTVFAVKALTTTSLPKKKHLLSCLHGWLLAHLDLAKAWDDELASPVHTLSLND
eukprot:10315540-Karenia_brevis.AAC.1